jgi:serine/threonine protein phosphatase PrpC
MTFILGGDAAIAVSRDHKPDQTDEKQRIEEAGGFVMWAGMFISLVYWPQR